MAFFQFPQNAEFGIFFYWILIILLNSFLRTYIGRIMNIIWTVY